MGLLDWVDPARQKFIGLLSQMPISRVMRGDAGGLLSDMAAKARDDRAATAATYDQLRQGIVPPVQGSLEDQTAFWNPGGLLGVVKPSAAMSSGVPVKLPQAAEFSQAVANTPNASITPDGLMMRVQRGQLPDQGQMESVRGGVFYLPEGAAQSKFYSTGKNGYGGPEKISGETLIRNPLFAKGGTGGKAPEAAYDSLAGKGAYQSMRNDALKVYGGYGANHSEKASLADKFLDKYAPELSGLGSYIVQKSGNGNQLAYALQEAAVGSAARAAGHDAVLGFSKGKNGPFLSELFDVRESHYPDKFGWSRMFPQFEP